MTSDRIWFDSEWIGRIIHFEESPSWMIVEKLEENTQYYRRRDSEESKFYSECSGIFICENTVTSTQAIMKVRMQIPYDESIDYHPNERAQQAVGEICGRTELETQALNILTDEECPSTPKLIAWKHEAQDSKWLGTWRLIDYIVMERLQGITLSPDTIDHLTGERKQSLRKAFKEAYNYLIDWETWRSRKQGEEWNDAQYNFWDLG
ncbi:hypothetical protein BDV24DRAFT_166383 [Aspergillus arachidicola]|uniref:Protein kinase domain-containing protein n=1 Tax=Aspergillus arachidicola TaxID=656916 RepID=A0A5N6XZG7_9EURO|nr:hypothetical protein BDV24DRAFT_166383 [Aspergillus arachidicola]